MRIDDEPRDSGDRELLTAMRERLPLEALLERSRSHWGYEDAVYRFYHQSYKVYLLQALTSEIVSALESLRPQQPLNSWFVQIVSEGTGRKFSTADNQRWPAATRPILEAFFHARFFLEMIVQYGQELEEPPRTLPSGWAAVLELYGLR